MEPNFDVDEYVVKDQLRFGIDEVRGDGSMQYADLLNHNQLYQDLQYDAEPYGHLSNSPDFVLYQTQSLPISILESSNHAQAWSDLSGPEPPHNSFTDGVYTLNSAMHDHGGWHSASTFQHSPDHSFSSPVDIPTQSNHNQTVFLSPTSTIDTSYFSQSSWNSSYTSMSPTTSVTESVASFDTAVEDPPPLFTESIPQGTEMLSSSSFSMIEYQPSGYNHQLSPSITPGGRRPRGRRGPLNEAQRRSTATMRYVKACDSCRARKAKVGSPNANIPNVS
jgi:hypothetical protein